MSLAWIFGLVLFVAAIDLVNGKYLIDQRGKHSENAQLAISPSSWRCEIDALEDNGNRLESCEDGAMDEDEFYVFHGGTCKVARTDPDTGLPIQESITCINGHWSGTGTSVDSPHSRQKRWFWIVVTAACWLWCGGGGGGSPPPEKKPPTFTSCPSSGNSYYTPSGQTSTTVTWTKPTATDSDGSIQSVTQVSGVSNGGSFEGSSSEGGRSHSIMYVATDNDGMIANCHFSFTVKVRTCEALSWLTNGYRHCPNDNILGSTCSYVCNEGYELSDDTPVTCQGEDNPQWSTIPTCTKVSCGAPPNVTNGDVDCAMGHNYGSYCVMSCPDGFELGGQVFTRCEAGGEWFWGVPTSCKDDVKPTLSCDKQQIFYVEKGALFKAVTWMPPTASDNIDPDPTVIQTSGPDQGVIIEAGNSEYVTYSATDTEGNESPECTIELRVEAASCGHPLDVFGSETFLTFDCHMGTYTYGDWCSVQCRLNLPLEGTDLITCEQNDTAIGEPSGYWDTGNGSAPYCRDIACSDIDPPLNGALVSDFINSRPVTTMLCNSEFDVPDLGFAFNGMFFCQDSGEWNPPYTKAPGCTETFWSRGFSLPSLFYYYDGVCSEDNTNILQAFDEIVAGLDETFKALCPDDTSCYVGNPKITCGPIGSRKKRRALTDSYQRHHDNRVKNLRVKRQTGDELVFSFNIITNFDISSMTTQQWYTFGDQIQGELKVAVQNGTYPVPHWLFREDSIQDYGDPYCDPGSVKVRQTKCNKCPPGYGEAGGKCFVCPIGEYADISGSVNCTKCPDGYSTRKTASESVDNCTELCRPGSYSPDTYVPCAPCKVGYYQPQVGQTSCLACQTAMSTKTSGSTSELDCQYFDVFLDGTQAHVIEAEIPILNNLTLTFFTKTVAATNDKPVTININDNFRVVISENIRVVTSSTDDVVGPSSPDAWIHVVVSWDSTASLLTASYRGDLVVNQFLEPSQTLNGMLSITAGDAGVLISGFRLQDTVISQAGEDTSSSSCQVVDDADVVSMDIFKDKGATGVHVMVPTVCDAVDECVSSPCGSHGNCTNDIGFYTCTCFGGWGGSTCDIPPDFCKNNECTNGASCISGTTKYTCDCTPGYTGVFCETPPVDGGWSEWSTWTECPVTCNTGTRTRSVVCNSPEPDEYGQDCQGDAKETEDCNTSPCPVCDELKRGFKSILNCETNPATGTQKCTQSCLPGYDLAPGLKIDKYTCGIDTDYEWVPLDMVPNCGDIEAIKRLQFNASVGLEPIEPAEEQSVKDAILSNVAKTDCFNSPLCEVSVDIRHGSERRRRSTSSTVTVTFSIPITDTSDLQLQEYENNGIVSPSLQEIIDAINNLEATALAINESANSLFEVTANGVTYSVNTDTVTFAGSTICADGLVPTNGLCAACPAGSYQNGDYCTFCDKGTYQDQNGQSSCLACPIGLSTGTIGSDNITDCTVTTAVTQTPSVPWTSSGTTVSTVTETRNKGNKRKVKIYIGVAVGVLVPVLIGVLVAFYCMKKHLSGRAKIGDSRVTIRGPEKMGNSEEDMQGHDNPEYSNTSAMASNKIGPFNTRFSREVSNVTVNGIYFETGNVKDNNIDLYN